MSDAELEKVEEIWVTITEGARITGYNRNYVQKLARDNWNMPEDERVIKTRQRSNGYEIWLPDLSLYIQGRGYGPQAKSSNE